MFGARYGAAERQRIGRKCGRPQATENGVHTEDIPSHNAYYVRARFLQESLVLLLKARNLTREHDHVDHLVREFMKVMCGVKAPDEEMSQLIESTDIDRFYATAAGCGTLIFPDGKLVRSKLVEPRK